MNRKSLPQSDVSPLTAPVFLCHHPGSDFKFQVLYPAITLHEIARSPPGPSIYGQLDELAEDPRAAEYLEMTKPPICES
ncbi:hypothetical protein EV424DRAFT_1309196 [Suillus variegatus]|nr:hypothetical protein EV424DRAFT_1309196 [Suillus variegatus]